MDKMVPSMDAWLKEAKAHPDADKVGMYLTHNGVVRATAKAKVRNGAEGTKPVTGMVFSYDRQKVDAAVAKTYEMDGIYYVRAWLNEGELCVGIVVRAYTAVGGVDADHINIYHGRLCGYSHCSA